MSKGNILQGQASGKLGDTVLMVRNGKQIARVYTTAGARSGEAASEAARLQRVKFGSASNQWQCYKFVCTRMYRKGRTTTQSDYNYFVKRNNLLFPYLTKAENADGVHMLQPGQFSEGNLGRIEMVHSYSSSLPESGSVLRLFDTQISNISEVQWGATLGELKAALKVVYPRARKITYLFSEAVDLSLTEEDVQFVSQQVNHYPVIIDLYSELAPNENNAKIKQYFGVRTGSTFLSEIIKGHNDTQGMCSSNNVIRIWATDQNEYEYLGNVALSIFATDDNVSDCYTSVLPANAVDPTRGVFAVWSSYRSKDSLRIAADSYGYQSGVMRDQVAAAGNDMNDVVTQYASVLRQVDKAAAENYVAELEAAGGAKARVVRSVVENQES